MAAKARQRRQRFIDGATDPVDSYYTLICADLHAAVEAYPPALRERCRADLAALLASDFSRLAALLPYQLADLLPVPEATCRRLGLATLALIWYANALDDLLDGAAPPPAMLGAQQALLLALTTCVELGLAATPAWADLMARALVSADAYAREVGGRGKADGRRQTAKAPGAQARLRQARPAALWPEPGEGHALWTPELLMDRAAPLGFVAVAQADLAGLPAESPLRADLSAALRALTGARQIADDAADWIDDLRAGQLNFVSAALLERFRADTPPEQHAGLTLERLVGYQSHREAVWEQIAAEHAALCDRAEAHLRPYAPCRLSALVARQRETGAATFARLRAHRAGVRGMLGLHT